MQLYEYPAPTLWEELCKRPQNTSEDLEIIVDEIFNSVRENGDEALYQYTTQFDKVEIQDLCITSQEIDKAATLMTNELKGAIELAFSNIKKFHELQISDHSAIETTKGVNCWRIDRPIEKIGIYIPGGSAPLFSTILMLGIPAILAGCKDIVITTPPDKSGNIHPTILYTANRIGINKIYKVGGIQAIAALTLGTQTIEKVYKIFGPGNQYVTAAKSFAQRLGMNIDMPAGPSEVLIIADSNCVPGFVASDLLAQAEHGADSQVMLLSDDIEIVKNVLREINVQIDGLPRKGIIQEALKNSKCIVLDSIISCVEFSNLYAPEHLILALKNSKDHLTKITNAGSIFLGNYSCESAGDYASGTNHTLPTNGFARSYSGVSLESFIKKISVQEISETGLKNIGPAIETMAEAEGLAAHKNAVSIRLAHIINRVADV